MIGAVVSCICQLETYFQSRGFVAMYRHTGMNKERYGEKRDPRALGTSSWFRQHELRGHISSKPQEKAFVVDTLGGNQDASSYQALE